MHWWLLPCPLRAGRWVSIHTPCSSQRFTVVVMILIAVFDFRSSSDPVHARIPYIYLAYIAAGIAWYCLRRKKAVSLMD